MARLRLATLTTLLMLAGCQAMDTGVAARTGTETTSIALAVHSTFDDDASGGEPGSLTFPDDSGIVYQLSAAQLVVRDLELYLPAGVHCSDIADQLGGGARCEHDDLARHGSDDTLPDDHRDPSGTDDTLPDDHRDPSGTDDTVHAEGDDKVVIPGPFVVDLVTGTSTPDLDGIVVPALAYRRLDIRVDDAVEGGELDRRSLLVRADFNYMDVAAELVLALRFNEDIRIEASADLALTPRLLVEFDAAQWLSGLSFGDCLDDGDLTLVEGTLTVDDELSGGCSDVENQVRDNLERSGRLLAGTR